MKKSLSAIALLIVVAACGSSPSGVDRPSNIENACSILDQRAGWQRNLRKVENKWGIPMNVILATIYHESKFDGDARTPLRFALGVIPMGRLSSAYGYSQALDGTWEEYQDAEGRKRAKRDQFEDAVDFMGWYMDGTTQGLGIAKTDARNQYLAYHEGRTGFARGSYNGKSWLIGVANKVANRSELYRTQLIGCGKL